MKKKQAASRIGWTLLGIFLLFGIVLALARGPAPLDVSREPEADLEPAPEEAPPGPESESASESIAQIQAAIMLRNRACIEALQRGDAAAYVENFTEDALSLPLDGPVLHGRAALQNAIDEALGRMRFLSAQTTSLDTRFNGHVVYETGRYQFVVDHNGKDAQQTIAGRYLIVWKRVGDQWKIALNAAQPGAPL